MGNCLFTKLKHQITVDVLLELAKLSEEKRREDAEAERVRLERYNKFVDHAKEMLVKRDKELEEHRRQLERVQQPDEQEPEEDVSEAELTRRERYRIYLEGARVREEHSIQMIENLRKLQDGTQSSVCISTPITSQGKEIQSDILQHGRC